MSSYINPIAINLGIVQIHWYAIFIITGIVIAIYMALKEAVRVGMSEDDIYDFVILGIPLAFVGARLYYVAFEWQYYKDHLNQLFAIWNGGIAIYGGLIAGLIFLIYFCHKRYLSILKYLDVIVPGVLLAQAIGRWGNFFNHEAYGPTVSRSFLENLHLPNFIINNMQINGAYHAPTFLYESVWSVIGVIILLSYRHFKKHRYTGEIFALYLIWYSFGRFFIEGLRMDSLYLFGTIRVSQLVSIILFIVGICIFTLVNIRKYKEYK